MVKQWKHRIQTKLYGKKSWKTRHSYRETLMAPSFNFKILIKSLNQFPHHPLFPHNQPNRIMVAGMYLTLSDGNLYQVITLCLRGPRQLLLSSPNTKHSALWEERDIFLPIISHNVKNVKKSENIKVYLLVCITDMCMYYFKCLSIGVLFPSLSSYRWLITGKRIIRRSRSLLRQGGGLKYRRHLQKQTFNLSGYTTTITWFVFEKGDF